MSSVSVDDCKIVVLPKISDRRGNLTFVEGDRHLPFQIRRSFFIYDIPTGESRGAHAHRQQEQFLLCLSGGYVVELDDGKNRKSVKLDRPWEGLYIPPMVWASETQFNPGSIVLVFVSDVYKESDYIRDYQEYLAAVRR